MLPAYGTDAHGRRALVAPGRVAVAEPQAGTVSTAADAPRLARMNDEGRFAEVLAAVWTEGGRAPGAGEAALGEGRRAAQCLGRWDTALALGVAVAEALEERGASALEQARAALLDFGPLVALGRREEADARLAACRAVIRRDGGLLDRAVLHAHEAHAARRDGDLAAAAAAERAALRCRYEAGDSEAAVHHYNLASLLMEQDARSAAALTHRLAAAVLSVQRESPLAGEVLAGLGHHVAAFGAAGAPLPADFAALCEAVREDAGVDLAALFDSLPPEAVPDGDAALNLALNRPDTAAVGEPRPLAAGVREAFEGALRSLAEARASGATAADVAPAAAGLRRTVLDLAPGNDAEVDAWLARLDRDPVALLAELRAGRATGERGPGDG